MTTTTVRERTAQLPARGRARPRALAVLGASVAALAVWAVAVPLLGVDLLVRPGGGTPQTVGAPAIMSVSLMASLLGWALLALLERVTARARPVWTAVAVAVLVLSLGGPVTGALTGAATVTLALMHLAVGAVLIPVLRGTSSTR